MVSKLYDAVNQTYSRIARQSDEDGYSQKVALSFGYSAEELSTIPEESNLGLSCGNPVVLAGLKEGETVLDLGCGASFDGFLAAQKDMLTRADLNAHKSRLTNTIFHHSNITHLPLPTATVSCIISNCVLNLVPVRDKPLVFAEMFRVLRPGGRVAVSDILAKRALPAAVERDMSLVVGCIAGASPVGEYEGWLRDAGFEAVVVVEKGGNLNVYKEGRLFDGVEQGEGAREGEGSCCGSGKVDAVKSKRIAELDFNEWVGSFNIYAIKPS